MEIDILNSENTKYNNFCVVAEKILEVVEAGSPIPEPNRTELKCTIIRLLQENIEENYNYVSDEHLTLSSIYHCDNARTSSYPWDGQLTNSSEKSEDGWSDDLQNQL